MEEKAGAFIWKDGVLLPDLDDEAMAGRQALEVPETKIKKTKPETPVEVNNA